MRRPVEPGASQLTSLGGRRACIGDTLVAAVGSRKLEPGAAYSPADLAVELGVSPAAVYGVITAGWPESPGDIR